jgi:hypothetical protein
MRKPQSPISSGQFSGDAEWAMGFFPTYTSSTSRYAAMSTRSAPPQKTVVGAEGNNKYIAAYG